MTRSKARRSRRWYWGVAAVALVALVVSLRPDPVKEPEPAQLSGRTSGYRIEDGTVAWRPLSLGEEFVVSVLSLGLAMNSEAVRGKTLPLADANSFRILSDQYGLDRRYVWFRGDRIEGADPRNFTVLRSGFSHDNTQMWHGTTPVMALQPGMADSIMVHSERIFSIAGQAWLTAAPPLALPEVPDTPPQHYCRDWFVMNDAIWLGAQKLLPLNQAPLEVLDCDGSIHRQYTDGQPHEVVDSNFGILLRTEADIWRLRLDAKKLLVARLPELPVQTLMIGNTASKTQMVLARAEAGTVYALPLQPRAAVQTLGKFDSLPERDDVEFDEAFLMGGHYFTMLSQRDGGDGTLTDRGPAKRLADLVLADGALFKGAHIVARPGALPLRVVDIETLLVDTACLNLGSYVTDVPDPSAEMAEIRAVCQTMRRQADILYDGLRIGFSPMITELGPADEDPELTLMKIGDISIKNVTDTQKTLAVDFLEGIDLRVLGTSIAPPDDAWPTQGLTLGPGETHSWGLNVQTDDDPRNWGYVVKMRHNASRAEVFGDAPFDITGGQFSE